MTEGNDILKWQDVDEAAAKIFNIWREGGELAWAQECWGHFSDAGLTRNMTVLETTTTCLRLVALARIYEEFCGFAWDENPDRSVCELAENLETDPVALGVLAAATNTDALSDAADEYELREAALLAVTDGMRGEIFNCLSQAYGGKTALYSRMSKTNCPVNAEDDEDEFEVTGPNASAYQFVTNGFLPA